MSWEAASVIVNSVLAAVTVGVLLVNRQQVKASKQQSDASQDQVLEMRKQVEASQQQLRVSRDQLLQSREQTKEQIRISNEQLQQSQKQVQDNLDAAHRPFVFPTSPLKLQENHDGIYFDFEHLDPHPEDADNDDFCLKLKNVGAGIALNIRALIVEPHEKTAEVLKLQPGALMAPGISTQRLPRVRSVILDTALPPGDDAKAPHNRGPFEFAWDTMLNDDPRYTLAAPPSPAAEYPYPIVARLTIFQDDIFGQTYASQFDFNDRGRWMFHWSGKVRPDSTALKRLQLKP